MQVDPLNLWLLLLATASGFAAFTFLPSVLEILKPKDKGPRKILRRPLHDSIRHPSKLRSRLDSKSIDYREISEDLKAALKDADVKYQRIGRNTVRVLGDLKLKANLKILENLVVRGGLVVEEHCVFHGSIKTYGNVSLGNSVIVEGNLLSKRNIDLKECAVIAGSVHTDGSVRIGEKVYVGLSVVAEGDVELFENSEVKNIMTRGSIKVLPPKRLDLPLSMYRID